MMTEACILSFLKFINSNSLIAQYSNLTLRSVDPCTLCLHRAGTTGGVGVGVTPPKKSKIKGPNLPRGAPGMLELQRVIY